MASSENLLNLDVKVQTTDEKSDGIQKCSGKKLSYNDFFWRYMNNNLPIVLTGISSDWKCRNNWTQLPNNNNATSTNVDNKHTITAINFDYLRRKVGNCSVPVADCTTEYYNSHAKCEMNFHDFLDYWENKMNANDTEILKEGSRNMDETTTKCTSKILYLKDWHLKAQMPDYDFYKVPKHFASDWLNEHLILKGIDDYRFVYMGPKESWTPLHSDVFGSFSWSTNIVGCKKWILLPPGEEVKLADRFGNLPFCIDEKLLQQRDVKFYELMQGENEAVFIPSGWYHQVWNLTDTISVNHNWFNACNVQQIWSNLSGNMQKVIAEIEDCRQMDNFEDHCQMMLRTSFGINYLEFIEMLESITQRRLSCYLNDKNIGATSSKNVLFDTFQLNDFHIRFDLLNIRKVLELMLQDGVICDSRATLYRRCLKLSEKLKDI